MPDLEASVGSQAGLMRIDVLLPAISEWSVSSDYTGEDKLHRFRRQVDVG